MCRGEVKAREQWWVTLFLGQSALRCFAQCSAFLPCQFSLDLDLFFCCCSAALCKICSAVLLLADLPLSALVLCALLLCALLLSTLYSLLSVLCSLLSSLSTGVPYCFDYTVNIL
jgi:hypothetical protein